MLMLNLFSKNVAAVCPNCHRRTEKSKDSDQFNNAEVGSSSLPPATRIIDI